MQKKFSVSSVEGLGVVVDYIIDLTSKYNFFTLEGELGSGKTTLIQQVCKRLGVVDNVTSPSFSIVNEYILNSHEIYHFDLYRIKEVDELVNIGAEEYFLSGQLCFVEWPSIGKDLFPDDTVIIEIDRNSDSREFNILFPD